MSQDPKKCSAGRSLCSKRASLTHLAHWGKWLESWAQWDPSLSNVVSGPLRMVFPAESCTLYLVTQGFMVLRQKPLILLKAWPGTAIVSLLPYFVGQSSNRPLSFKRKDNRLLRERPKNFWPLLNQSTIVPHKAGVAIT